ncbi:MAG: putative DNA modification/repair radical SAM protein [Chloroflexi bacterium]|nr:putative DNA modification/repair radical SAM protein [Chloroflexota bacterium]
MDTLQKMDLLGEAAQYDICRDCSFCPPRVSDDVGRWIYPAVRPDGRRIKLLKVLQSNVCEKDCAYCGNRSGRDVRRTTFSPDELARLFSDLVRSRLAEGLFLSSGVCGHVDRAMGRMLATAELLRHRYGFGGYLHLKILPGADSGSIEAAVGLAQRVSVNLEAPSAGRIAALSSTKDYGVLLAGLREADRLRGALGRPVSITTQYVAGGSGESDRELLETTARLYRDLRLARAYFSAFQPVRDTPLENQPATPGWREHRLYQADFLLRWYGFGIGEFVYDGADNLPQSADPKMAWALAHPEHFPIELNMASRHELLRVPGIGPKGADVVLARRRQGTLRDLEHLGLTRSNAARAVPFVLLDGRALPRQLSLW